MQTVQSANRLASLFTLGHSVEIVIPSTIAIDQVASVDSIAATIDQVAKDLSIRFGGATITKGSGVWYSSELSSLVAEDVTIIKSFASELTQSDIEAMIDIAEWVKSSMLQESVLITLDGKAYLV